MTSLSLPLPGTARRTAFGKIVHNEARLAWRRPAGLIGGLGVPLLLLVIFGELPSFKEHLPGLGGLTLFNTYVPVLVVFGLAMLALLGLPGPLVSYREQGILRRLSTTPVPPSWVLAAQGVVQFCITMITLAVILVVSIAVFGASAPKSPGGLVLSVLLSVSGLFPLGLLIAAMARTANSANVIGRLTFFPMMFFAGLWLPIAAMPSFLRHVSHATPLGAAAQALQDSWQGHWPHSLQLITLAIYAVVFTVAAARLFRWE
jgi:ABC-2 type transport system permease protein